MLLAVMPFSKPRHDAASDHDILRGGTSQDPAVSVSEAQSTRGPTRRQRAEIRARELRVCAACEMSCSQCTAGQQRHLCAEAARTGQRVGYQTAPTAQGTHVAVSTTGRPICRDLGPQGKSLSHGPSLLAAAAPKTAPLPAHANPPLTRTAALHTHGCAAGRQVRLQPALSMPSTPGTRERAARSAARLRGGHEG